MLLALATAVFAVACTGSPDSGDQGSSSNNGSGGTTSTGNGPGSSGAGAGSTGTGTGTVDETVLDERVIDYSEALRTASLKLVRRLPTLEQIKAVSEAGDLAAQKAAYEAQVDAMFEDPRFTARMIKWWRDVMRQGGGGNGDQPSRDTAPVFAARLTVEGQPYTNLFTQATNTCPTYDEANNAFQDGDCDNGVPAHAGVLTNPGVMFQYYSNMAFRRVRWVQEVFTCSKFPAEYREGDPVKIGAAEFTSPWDFDSISGGAGSRIDFKDTSSVVCANCHTTMNHIAPLFGNFDMNGMWQDSIQVETPVVPPDTTQLTDWLPEGKQDLAWRFGKPVTDLPGLGAAIAADPIVHECAVARAWNFAMSKEDIVSDMAAVPTTVIAPYISSFTSNSYNLKKVMIEIFKSEDFVKF
jgi:hypothetical protein